jgi:hypothetical protein
MDDDTSPAGWTKAHCPGVCTWAGQALYYVDALGHTRGKDIRCRHFIRHATETISAE